jgi:hypothetical protein
MLVVPTTLADNFGPAYELVKSSPAYFRDLGPYLSWVVLVNLAEIPQMVKENGLGLVNLFKLHVLFPLELGLVDVRSEVVIDLPLNFRTWLNFVIVQLLLYLRLEQLLLDRARQLRGAPHLIQEVLTHCYGPHFSSLFLCLCFLFMIAESLHENIAKIPGGLLLFLFPNFTRTFED